MAQPLKVWSRFSVTNETGTYKYKIVEPSADRFEDITELMLKHFVKDESIAKATGLTKNENAMAEFKPIQMGILKDEDLHTVICCLDNDNDEIGEIIGGSFITLKKKALPFNIKFRPETEPLQKYIEVIMAMVKAYDIITEQNVDQYYDGRGLVVHSNYRGLGIGQELLKTRRLICQELGVPLTAAFMTAYGTQIGAQRDGWETVYEYNYEELGREHNITFDKNGPPTAKLMIARV